MALGNGTFPHRFGYSANLKPCASKCRACSRCLANLEADILPLNCALCACWDTLSPHVRFLAPLYYLPELVSGPNKDLVTIKLSFASVIQSQKNAVSKFVDNIWNADTVVTYLGYKHGTSKAVLYATRQADLPGQNCPIDEDQPWKPLVNIPVMELEDFLTPQHTCCSLELSSLYTV
jgi:hypothetical protein